jgi:hypothetical protein
LVRPPKKGFKGTDGYVFENLPAPDDDVFGFNNKGAKTGDEEDDDDDLLSESKALENIPEDGEEED